MSGIISEDVEFEGIDIGLACEGMTDIAGMSQTTELPTHLITYSTTLQRTYSPTLPTLSGSTSSFLVLSCSDFWGILRADKKDPINLLRKDSIVEFIQMKFLGGPWSTDTNDEHRDPS